MFAVYFLLVLDYSVGFSTGTGSADHIVLDTLAQFFHKSREEYYMIDYLLYSVASNKKAKAKSKETDTLSSFPPLIFCGSWIYLVLEKGSVLKIWLTQK